MPSQGFTFLGFLAAGVLIYSAVTDNPVFDVITGKTAGSASGHGDLESSDGGGDANPDVGMSGGGIDGMVAKADEINQADLPYVWGGGHQSAGSPSTGTGGSKVGYDCSGCVGSVLTAGGFWTPGSSLPTDAGIIAQLRKQGIIAPGLDHGSPSCNIYDNPGDHIFMELNGRLFGTSDGDDGTSNHSKFGMGGGGGTWLDTGPDVPVFQHFHILAELLNGSNQTTSDPSLTGTSDSNAAGSNYHHGDGAAPPTTHESIHDYSEGL